MRTERACAEVAVAARQRKRRSCASMAERRGGGGISVAAASISTREDNALQRKVARRRSWEGRAQRQSRLCSGRHDISSAFLS